MFPSEINLATLLQEGSGASFLSIAVHTLFTVPAALQNLFSRVHKHVAKHHKNIHINKIPQFTRKTHKKTQSLVSLLEKVSVSASYIIATIPVNMKQKKRWNINQDVRWFSDKSIHKIKRKRKQDSSCDQFSRGAVIYPNMTQFCSSFKQIMFHSFIHVEKKTVHIPKH